MDNTPKAADGLLVGKSHAEGGIKIQTPEGQIEAEGGEVIINKRSMASDEKLICEGTPKQIASKINEYKDGVQFAEGGGCRVVSTGEPVEPSGKFQNDQMAEDGMNISSESNQPMKKYTITSVLDPDITWQADDEELLEYIQESQDEFDYVADEPIAESLRKMGLVMTTNINMSDYKEPSEDIEQAAHGTVIRSTDASVRPSPSISATIFDVGTKMRGNDGNIWEIIEDSRGVRRWKKIKAADGITITEKHSQRPVMERIDSISEYKELWVWHAKPEMSVDFFLEYENSTEESSSPKWDYRTESVYHTKERFDVVRVSGYEFIGITDDSGEVVFMGQDIEDELKDGLKRMYERFLSGENKDDLYSGRIVENHKFFDGGPISDFHKNVNQALSSLKSYIENHDNKIKIHGGEYEYSSMTPMYIRVTGGRGATYNIVPFFPTIETSLSGKAHFYSLTRAGIKKDFAITSEYPGNIIDLAEDGAEIKAESGIQIRGLEMSSQQRHLQTELSLLRDDLKEKNISMDEYYQKRNELYQKYGVIKAEDGKDIHKSSDADVGYQEPLEWLEENSSKILEYYLPGSSCDERVSQTDLREKGDYVIESSLSQSGETEAYIDICFGDEYEKNKSLIEENYDSYKRYAEKITDGEVLFNNVEVLTDDSSKTIMFLFTGYSGGDSRNKELADGGNIDEKYPFEHKGKKFNVTPTNAMKNDRGQALYKIDIADYGSYHERAANIDLAKNYAMVEINKIVDEENSAFKDGGDVGADILKSVYRSIDNAIAKKKTMRLYDKWQGENYHSRNALLIAKAVGTDQQIKDAENILIEQQKEGLSDENYNKRKDITLGLWHKFVEFDNK